MESHFTQKIMIPCIGRSDVECQNAFILSVDAAGASLTRAEMQAAALRLAKGAGWQVTEASGCATSTECPSCAKSW